MANSYFRFKQFTIEQEHCAMKVCTDACLFGSLLPTASGGGEAIKRVLDIGTGTGLLSLMYAQKNSNVFIDAVEIDEAAAKQAKENFEASPWNRRLKVHHASIQQFSESIHQQYDLIIANPPFFENDLRSNDSKRNIALHNDALQLENLLSVIQKLLTENGNFAVLLPYHRTGYFQQMATAKGFYLAEKILVKQTPIHAYFRSMLFFSSLHVETRSSEIVIQNETREYTPGFALLLKDYYLYL